MSIDAEEMDALQRLSKGGHWEFQCFLEGRYSHFPEEDMNVLKRTGMLNLFTGRPPLCQEVCMLLVGRWSRVGPGHQCTYLQAGRSSFEGAGIKLS